MSKKPVSKAQMIAEAFVLTLFMLATAFGSLHMLHVVALTSQAQAAVGYVLGGFAVIVFLYMAWQTAKNRG